MSRPVKITHVPTDEEIRQFRNVPVSKACAYLGIGANTLKLAIIQGRVPFGFIACGKQNTLHISPEALINYYHNGLERRFYEDQDSQDRS